MQYIIGGVKVHPRKRVKPLPEVDSFGRPWPTELCEVYYTYSEAKAAAMRDCLSLCRALDGRKFRITSFNTCTFCVAFEAAHPETGELMVVRVAPRSRDAYFIEG